MRRALALVLLVSLFGASLPARADQNEARDHFERGEVLYAQGDFAAALDEYLAAFAAEPLPELLFNVGQCQRNLDRYADAIFSFRRYLGLRPDAPNREAVLRLIADLEKRRARAEVRPPPPSQPREDLVPAPPPRRPGKPFYKSWWFITGVVVASVAVTSVAIVAASDDGGGGGTGDPGGALPPSDLGNVELPP